MFGVSSVAKGEARRAVQGVDGEVVDIVSDANPGVPWCWSVMVLQRAADRPADALVARRATLSLLPGVWPAASCASARLSAQWTDAGAAPSYTIVWHRRWRIDVDELRALYLGNCRVRAWLQFGRVPHVANGTHRGSALRASYRPELHADGRRHRVSRLSFVCDRLGVASTRRDCSVVRCSELGAR